MGHIHFILFLLSSLLTDCILGSVLECDSDSDCINEASCVGNLCVCQKGYVFSTDGTQCLSYSRSYAFSCQDHAQCSWLMGKYYCNSGSCDCETGYRYFLGQCVLSKTLGESCTRNEECHVTNDMHAMMCSDDGICTCSEGYYARGDYDCRPEATELYDACALETDCKMENAYCSIYQCVATESRHLIENYTITNAETTRQLVTYELGVSCDTTEDCQDVENSICSALVGECVCKRGYFYDARYGCVGEVGQDVGCIEDSDCIITPRKCENGACVCPPTHYHNRDQTKCIRVAYTPNFYCTDQIACHIFGKNALCVVEDEGVYSTCRCPLNYELNEDYICEATDMPEECESNACVTVEDCTITNSICFGGTCVCPDHYRNVDGVCLPNIGGECDADNLICEISNTECVDSICACTEDYVALDETTCVGKASGLHDDCDYDVQCSSVLDYSVCISGECICGDNYIENINSCWEPRGYGDYCVNLQQCHAALGENVKCRNSICQCSADMIRTNDGLDCMTKSDATVLQKPFVLFIFSLFSIFYFMY